MKILRTGLILFFLLGLQPETAWASNVSQQQRVDVSYPCSVVLNPVNSIPNARGVALITKVKRRYTDAPNSSWWERESVSIHADWLPAPSSFGDYDSYEGFAQVQGEISWRFNLTPVHDPQSFIKGITWVGNFYAISYGVPVNTRVQVRLSNSKTHKLGPAVLENTLENCH
ncbi:hypothetical protein [Alicyclobacillus fastidiosus]|uniref:DUF5626 domain-containing protein n=1 Tax=Alicyclobacillus fastidiosus TaxID=392011 RepID=A0ABV5A9V3_9BACL|nr:hypothetical protein [Alicyclobacillus fastidiosus]WEH10968.1 hypothetical protein PYS47_07060 [Alicyclobacillus fastidiosus]